MAGKNNQVVQVTTEWIIATSHGDPMLVHRNVLYYVTCSLHVLVVSWLSNNCVLASCCACVCACCVRVWVCGLYRATIHMVANSDKLSSRRYKVQCSMSYGRN